MKFRTIIADPPWAYENWSQRGTGRAASRHYETQQMTWLETLPVGVVADRDCALLLWATNPLLPAAFRLLSCWGFEYKTLITWVKMARQGAPRIGLGYHVRACTEHLLIATKGNPPAPSADVRPDGAFFHPRGEHSAKPDHQYTLAENYPGPYLELFHRPLCGLFPPREGWTFLGDAVDGRDIREAIHALGGAERQEALTP